MFHPKFRLSEFTGAHIITNNRGSTVCSITRIEMEFLKMFLTETELRIEIQIQLVGIQRKLIK